MLSNELAIKSKTVTLSGLKVLEALKGPQKEINEEAVDVEKAAEEEVITKAAQEERRRQVEDEFRSKAAEEGVKLKAKEEVRKKATFAKQAGAEAKAKIDEEC